MGPRTGLMGAKIPAHTGIRHPFRPASSQSLYRLSYPGQLCVGKFVCYLANKVILPLPVGSIDTKVASAKRPDDGRQPSKHTIGVTL